MSSILTNSSAMTALSVLRKTNQELSVTQNRISTGLKVGTAKDNASFWAVSQVMKSDVGAFKAIGDNLSLAQASTSVARVGAEKIAELISNIKGKVTSAQEGSLDKAKIQADVDAMLSQIKEISKSANFNGVNLLESKDTVKLLSSIGRSGASATASYIDFQAQDLSVSATGGLKDIDGLNVLGRGDQVMQNATDGVGKAVIGVTGATAMAIGDKVKINYTDKDGVGRTFEYAVKQAIGTNHADRQKLVEELNADSAFSKLFKVSFDPTANSNAGEFQLSAASRDTNVTVNSWSANAFAAKQWDSAFGDIVLTTNNAAQSTVLTFGFTDWSGKNVSVTLNALNFDTDDATPDATNAATARTAIETQLRAKLDELGYDGSRVTVAGGANAITIESTIGSFSSVNSSVAQVTFGGNQTQASTVTIAGNSQTETLQFRDAALAIGEEIKLNFTVGANADASGVAKEIIFRVVDGDTASGIRLDNGSTANQIVLALDARKVAADGVTGSTIAAEMKQALDTLGGANAYGVNNSTARMGGTANALWSSAIATTAATDGQVQYAVSGSTLTLNTDGTAKHDRLGVAGLPTTDYQALLDRIEKSYTTALDAAAALGSTQARVDIQRDFVSSMMDNLKIGIGTLVDADMTEESARLQALQVQQQLGIQSLSMANQAPQMLLSLFR